MTISIQLSPEDVREAVRLYLLRDHDMETVGEVSLDITPMWTGYGTSERQEYTFTGASAKVLLKK